MRILAAALLSLALAGGFSAEARAEGVRLSSAGVRIAADAMAVRGRVCTRADTAEPNLTLQVLNRSGEVVGVLPVELLEPPGAEAGCAYYAMDVQIRLSESARICVVDEGQPPETAVACAPRMQG